MLVKDTVCEARGEITKNSPLEVVTNSRNGAERNGTELRSKIRNGTGLKCGTAKSRNMEGGAVTASAIAGFCGI